MEDKLEKLEDFYDLIVWDSLKAFMKDGGAKSEYILMDEIPFDEKIRDLDGLLEWAEGREWYEECGVVLDMKKQIIENHRMYEKV